ncbi:hypothetical protein ACNAN0_12740 [Agrilactobacillus fermenti]|uniref:hypothetical protein n=1 Tax=Agrilactobacillus fermenti TaxID=2586909 RepID=UPI001E41DCC4|nr:hypothetical protein [Agrilactobacillus fermenti]MCD2257174.1 hypothetical protein [Agrilactobacillus fermenti]
MNELQFDQLVTKLGQLREQVRQLEDVDYMTAYYKGYSQSGATIDEIQSEIDQLNQEADDLQTRIDELEGKT